MHTTRGTSSRRPVWALRSSPAASEVRGQPLKPPKSARGAFCLSLLLPSPLVRGAITKTFFLGARKTGKKPKSSAPSWGPRPSSIHEMHTVFSGSGNCRRGRRGASTYLFLMPTTGSGKHSPLFKCNLGLSTSL